jgi:hypothetical protein
MEPLHTDFNARQTQGALHTPALLIVVTVFVAATAIDVDNIEIPFTRSTTITNTMEAGMQGMSYAPACRRLTYPATALR